MNARCLLLGGLLLAAALEANATMDFQEWESLSDEQRGAAYRSWNTYDNQAGDDLLEDIAAAFRLAHPAYDIPGFGNVFGSLQLGSL